eukprot:GSChrysophyteH1.ASY1.ANO1.3295.1 assembled CDS
MYVLKRDGRKEEVHFEKITSRIRKLCYGLEAHVDPTSISQKVIQGVFPGVCTTELDELAAETAASCATQHPDYSTLAARISVSNLHKQTSKVFSDVMTKLEELYATVMENKDRLNSAMIYDRDFNYDYFGFKTLSRAYLMSMNKEKVIVERPQHMIMRVCLGIHGRDIDAALESYDLMSRQYFIHATPTLFNAGTPKPQLSSYIRGTNGTSNGIVPMLRVFNNTARYVDQERARDLFYAMWLYCRYEQEGRARKTLPAQELWLAIMASQVETGTPYMLYKDACNRKSNQQNLGTIKSSNLCTEVVEYTAPDEVAVCNLASSRTYDLKRLYEVTKVVTKNLNKNSNKRHRPIGIGVQGLADTFARLRYPFDSAEACKLNRDIFEAMYFAAVESSCELAEKEGTYSTYEGSPMSQGKLQPDIAKVAQHGVRNSLLLAPMPTASTACIMGNNESTEPFTSNMYNRRVLAGEFTVVNKYLLKDLVHNGLWTPEVRNQIIADRGSIQNTVWEIPQKIVINQAADRGAFICQSQSLNIHMAAPNTKKMTSMHFYAWKKGLKTGMYYLRTRPKADAIQFTVDQTALVSANENVKNKAVKAADVSVKLASDSMHTGAIKGLDTAEETACESCSA